MNYHLISAQRDQMFLLPPAFDDWLPSDHLVYQVVDAVQQVDMAPFLSRYNPEGVGQAAFDPELMVALLLFGYCVGERSSRRLERLCYEHVAFRVVTGNRQPHFTTIARFRREHEAALESVFVKVLDLCARAGLIDLSLLAIDGTKIAANASLSENRDEKWIDEQVRRMLAEAEATDAAEDEQYGERRGDELAGACADREERLRKLRAAKKELEEQQDARDLEFASRVLERKREEQALGRKKRGRKPEPLPVPEDPQVNLTDPQSRIMKERRGFMQGFNAQAVVSTDQIVLAAGLTQDANDVQQLEPMLELMHANLDAIETLGTVGTVLADAGYWSEQNATGATAQRDDVLIATRNPRKARQAERERLASDGPQRCAATPRERMEERLRSEAGKAAYARRGCIVEPPFGHIKEVRRGRRFMRRGFQACRSEWVIMCTAHNLCKLHRSRAASGRNGFGLSPLRRRPVRRRRSPSTQRVRRYRFERLHESATPLRYRLPGARIQSENSTAARCNDHAFLDPVDGGGVPPRHSCCTTTAVWHPL